MTPALPLFHAVAGTPVIVVGEGDGEAGGDGYAARRRLVERAGGIPVGADDPVARIAFIAMAEPEGIAADLRARGVLVNVMDRPDLCDFTVPSLLERGAVQIAVGTGGVSAGLAKALRLRLETLLPPGLGALAQALGAARGALRQRLPDAASRRRALDAALAQGGLLDPLDPGSPDRVGAWLAGTADSSSETVTVTLRSADPDDLTLGEARLLGSADRVIHDAGVPSAIMARLRADAVRCEVGTAPAEGLSGAGLTVILRGPGSPAAAEV